MKVVISILVSLFSFVGFSQTNLLFHKVDTLKADFRSGGKSNDSLDLYFAEKQTTLPGGTQNNPFGVNGNDYFNFFQQLPKQYRNVKVVSPVFTGLPHLGFMYSVGSGGLQYLHADYQQTLKGKTHLALHYNRNVSATLYKQSAFSLDGFTISLAKYGVKWKHLMEGSATSIVRNLNGGVVSDDKMLLNYGIEYAPIQKSVAGDSSNRYYLHHQTVWNIFKKDSISKIESGFVFNNQLRVDRRVFRETDTISKLYPKFGNPNFTRDLSQLSFLESTIAYFYKNARSTTELGVNRVYWIYKTAASQVKNALNITLDTRWNIGKSTVSYGLMQNLIGQGNQYNHGLIWTHQLKKGVQLVELIKNELVPEPFQRLYFGNTIAWKMPTIQKQGLTAFMYSYSGNGKMKLNVKVGYKQMQNNYFFIKDTWRNDTLTNIQQFYVSAACNLRAGNFYLQPRFTYNHLNNSSLILPKFDVRARMFWKKKLRNKEKYEVLLGGDVYAKSDYNLLSFDSRLSTFSIDNPTNLHYKSVIQTDFFIGMSVDEIRFYFKYENLDNFWNSHTNRVVIGYPVMPKILRIGLTWDFLN
jgi:hypothetical protein